MSPELQGLGRLLILFGAVMSLCGVVLLLSPKLPWIGRLPGDIIIQKENFSFYFPVVSCLLASMIISILLWVVSRFRP